MLSFVVLAVCGELDLAFGLSGDWLLIVLVGVRRRNGSLAVSISIILLLLLLLLSFLNSADGS